MFAFDGFMNIFKKTVSDSQFLRIGGVVNSSSEALSQSVVLRICHVEIEFEILAPNLASVPAHHQHGLS